MAKDEKSSRDDTELQREVRSERRFSLAEAIGREGGELLRGASPVTRKRQTELAIGQLLDQRLADSEGALKIVLRRSFVESELLLERAYDEPLAVLVDFLRSLLASEPRLERFVRAVDREWGRIYLERPHFELPGRPPHPDDPYTRASVHASLSQLLEDLS